MIIEDIWTTWTNGNRTHAVQKYIKGDFDVDDLWEIASKYYDHENISIPCEEILDFLNMTIIELKK